MEAKQMLGKEVVPALESVLQEEVRSLKERNIEPTLAILMVGDNADSVAYANSAKKIFEKNGLICSIHQYPKDLSQDGFLRELENFNREPKVHGILIMQPFPPHISANAVRDAIAPEKDVDGLSLVNAGKIMAGDPSGFPPATPAAVMEMLDYYGIELKGKKAVVLGRSLVVGKPMAMLLLGRDATVTLCHSKTANLPAVAREADILIAAIGKAEMVKADYIRQGACVIDVGINVVGDKIVGDVAFGEVAPLAAHLTPVPGGVGAVTTRVLAKHVVRAAKMANGG